MRRLFFISLMVLLLTGQAGAQQVTAVATPDTTDILIGDQIEFSIEFTMPLDYRVLWPFQKDTLTRNVEIIRQSPVDTAINEAGNLVKMFQTFTITSFDSGYYRIPPLKFRYQPIDDTVFMEASTMPSYLRVHTMAVDTSQAIKAIKPPLRAPLTFREVLPWLLISLAALAITLLIVYVISRRKKKQPLFTIRPRPVLPPHIIALNGLEALRGKKLWQAGKVKDFYTELTDIVRVYIEDRFGVNAVEMTTDEILDGMRNTDANREAIGRLSQMLKLADLVKFAKEKPLPVDNDNSLNNSIVFVNDTKPETEKPEEPAARAEKDEIKENTEDN